jgi:hypothetical protein
MSNSAELKIDTTVMIKNGGDPPPLPWQTPHPALMELARTLGIQAGRHFKKYRFTGLGKIALIQHQTNFDKRKI